MRDQEIDDRIVVAVRARTRWRRFTLERLVQRRRLETGTVERQPAQVGAAQRVIKRGGEPGLREQVGEVDEDGDLFGNQGIAMFDRRHFAHRVDGEIVRLALFSRLHVERMQRIGRAKFFKQNQRSAGAGVGSVEQRN